MSHLRTARAVGLALLAVAAGCADDVDPRPAELPYLVEAILRPSCGTAACHSSLTQTEGLVFDTLEGTRATLNSEPDLVSVLDPEASKLLRVLDGSAARMPPDAPIPDADIALIRAWIVAGADLGDAP
ncbi:MAG: c-type cytochrome domain-containing protein [Kofleriaceae bacterium]